LMNAAANDPAIAAWLQGPQQPPTEVLPSALQSRWVNSYPLPSRHLELADIDAAAAEEADTFRRVFGVTPQVVVPPTFVWESRVESAWSSAGIRYCITPGRRYHGRDSSGAPSLPGPRIYNGERSASGLMYLVRERYFEPSRGHRADRVLGQIDEDLMLGRPTLLETHRYNFLGDAADASFSELESLLQRATERFPQLAFISTETLADAIRDRDPDWIETRFLPRLRVWLRRIRQVPRFGRLARMGLFGLPLPWLSALLGRTARTQAE